MKKSLILLMAVILSAFTACSDDDSKSASTQNVAFSVPSLNLTAEATPIQIKFSEATTSAGTLTIDIDVNGVVYGTDFSTNPAAVSNKLVVPFGANVTSVDFTFNKLIDAIEGQVKNVVFTISDVSIDANITGNKLIQVNFNETALLGSSLAAEVGGPTQPNQVYIDLSSGAMTKVPRVSWDLGFETTEDFKVILNGSVKMAAKKLETTNIDLVQEEDATMIISQGQGFVNQIDDPTGDLTRTAIAEISENNDDNKVYLINMGSNPATNAPAVGSEGSASGTSRGWKKVRILRSGNDYKVQYADINATTHQEVTISKNAAFNFTFFSFANGVVNVQPQKNQWDINFTTFTNVIGGTTPYYYPDFVVNNVKGGAQAYQVLVADFTFDNFKLENVINGNFNNDQRNIGSNWRGTSATGGDGMPVSQFVLKTDRFFVVKDPAGNIYKLKFTGGANASGERGFPTFQYVLLR